MPFDVPGDKHQHEHDPSLAEAARAEYKERVQEQEVRIAAQRILADHLRIGRPRTFWDNIDIDLDLTKARLINLDMTECVINSARFGEASFVGTTKFSYARFSYSDFRQATFTGRVDFRGSSSSATHTSSSQPSVGAPPTLQPSPMPGSPAMPTSAAQPSRVLPASRVPGSLATPSSSAQPSSMRRRSEAQPSPTRPTSRARCREITHFGCERRSPAAAKIPARRPQPGPARHRRLRSRPGPRIRQPIATANTCAP
ncbi:hypothetical protein CF165_39860 [Amycolatopsis vastitatis]|uniref:Pentapeptide repeat-containing protein n=1 Tax=Amycolatopsis vastitatis TaxID=1905142 RepID=A0A229SPZ0_9PSEU|nr:hypothetical protein CF165_39860 [Amycolatopsis vastitatis]